MNAEDTNETAEFAEVELAPEPVDPELPVPEMVNTGDAGAVADVPSLSRWAVLIGEADALSVLREAVTAAGGFRDNQDAATAPLRPAIERVQKRFDMAPTGYVSAPFLTRLAEETGGFTAGGGAEPRRAVSE